MAEAAKGPRRPTVEEVPAIDPDPAAPSADATTHGTATCPVAWCPVCLAVTAVQPVKPEVVEHLLRAGAEFFLAMRSLIDARADDLDRSGTQDGDDDDLHRIDIG
jgi:hypothetical protein